MPSVLQETRKASGYISGYIPPVVSLKGKDYLKQFGVGTLWQRQMGKKCTESLSPHYSLIFSFYVYEKLGQVMTNYSVFRYRNYYFFISSEYILIGNAFPFSSPTVNSKYNWKLLFNMYKIFY